MLHITINIIYGIPQQVSKEQGDMIMWYGWYICAVH